MVCVVQGFEVYSKALGGKPKSKSTQGVPPLPRPVPSSDTTPASVSVPSSVPGQPVAGVDVPLDEDKDEDEEDYDIVSKDEVQHVNAEGEEEEEERDLCEEEVVAGLQAMFVEKHGREAGPEEVQQWLEAISGLKGEGSGLIATQQEEQGEQEEVS